MRNITYIIVVLMVSMVFSACVTHRDTRTEIFDDNTYLDKDFLTRPNPGHVPGEGEDEEYGWLMGVSLTAVSVPAPITDIFPALQAEVEYVRFQFTQNSVQIVDGVVPGPYAGEYTEDPDNLPDIEAASDLAPRVLQEYKGSHIDIRLRKNLDGEVTNYVEEYKERDWVDRQFFRTELDNGALADLARVYWYYNWAVSDALSLKSASLVPDSFRYVDTVAEESNFCDDEDEGCVVDWEKGDYMEWKVRVTYAVNLNYTNSLLNMRADIDTQTMDIKYSLWRRVDPPEESEYVVRPIGEKDKYRRKFGIWDTTIHHYQDTETGLVGAQMYLQRFNSKLPIDYYLVDVPNEYLESEHGNVYDEVAKHTNEVFTKAGVDTRIAFHDADEGGITREFGDIRYSFVVWHNNMFTGIPWLGYGPSWVDPRTGEIINATLNFNNYMGLHYYTYVAKDILSEAGSIFDEGGTGSCTPGERRQIDQEVVNAKLWNTTMYSKMKSYMQQDPEDWVVKHDEDWYKYYHMMLSDLRYFYPPYQTFVYSPKAHMKAMQPERAALMAKDYEFLALSSKIDSQTAPWGTDDISSPAGMESLHKWTNDMKQAMLDHQEFEADRQIAAGVKGMCLSDGPLLLTSIADINQKCKADGTWQTFEEWEDEIRWRITVQISIHELGHNIGQWHNFYGSADKLHAQPCTGCVGRDKGPSNSVMDYVHHFAEVGADLGWYPYDWATLIYGYRYNSQDEVDAETDSSIIEMLHPEWVDGTPEGEKDMSKALLFANDYYRPLSPLVDTFDLGTTPSEIVFNHIQYYDFMYRINNFRSFRQYWTTWSYPNRAYGATFPLRRFLELWALDFADADLENDLRILGVDEDEMFFDNLKDEFNKEMGQASRMTVNFFQAILNQSNGERSYATTYDSYFGDVTRLGIIYDKLYAMFSFLGLWPADMYNWDLYALLAYYDGNKGDSFLYSDALDTLTVMLGGSYDVYPWFLPNAVMLFAQDTHSISFGDQAMKEWIGMRAFSRQADMLDYFGFDPRTECMSADGVVEVDCATAAFGADDDGHQSFRDVEGNEWVYVFLYDQNKHICASIDLNPISSKMIWDYNEDVNISKATYASTYNIKWFLDFYEFFESPYAL